MPGEVRVSDYRKWDDQIADLVSEGLSISAAGRALGITQQRASQIWRRIVAGLGWQAQ